MTSQEARPEPGREEIEVKLPCQDLDAIREKLAQKGAVRRGPLHFESNDLFDDREGSLARKGCTLRLRRAEDRTTLTFKGPAHFERGLKRREEREIAVSDPEETEAILVALGLKRRFRYEKRREEWTLGACAVALDSTPIGSFVEVEGDPSAIRRVVVALELDFACAIPYSYAKLYALRRQEDASLPEDMVFRADNP